VYTLWAEPEDRSVWVDQGGVRRARERREERGDDVREIRRTVAPVEREERRVGM